LTLKRKAEAGILTRVPASFFCRGRQFELYVLFYAGRITHLSSVSFLRDGVFCHGSGRHLQGYQASNLQTGRFLWLFALALQQPNDEQILLNLVRLKYRDTPIFIEVSGINSKLSFEASAEAGAEVEESAPGIFTLGGGVAYATEPVVTYTPLQGEEFIQRLLSPNQSGYLHAALPVGLEPETHTEIVRPPDK
jgi:hypothetical protein